MKAIYRITINDVNRAIAMIRLKYGSTTISALTGIDSQYVLEWIASDTTTTIGKKDIAYIKTYAAVKHEEAIAVVLNRPVSMIKIIKINLGLARYKPPKPPRKPHKDKVRIAGVVPDTVQKKLERPPSEYSGNCYLNLLKKYGYEKI